MGGERAVASFDKYNESYEAAVARAISFAGADHDVYVAAKADVLLDVVERELEPPRTVSALDVGCGLGLAHTHLASLGRLEGIDVSEALIDEAARRNPSVRYKTYDGATLPYQDATFDLSFAMCVLHHVPPEMWPRFLSELVRVTRTGGLVAVFEHNPVNPFTRLVVRRCAFDSDAVLVPRARLEALLAGAGATMVASRYLLFSPWPRLRGPERWLANLPLGAQYVTHGKVVDADTMTATSEVPPTLADVPAARASSRAAAWCAETCARW